MFDLTNVNFDKVKIRDLVESQYAGEWGDDSYFPNANVIRATEIKNNGEINYSTAVKRKIDPQQLERKKLQFGDILVEGSGGSPIQPVGRIAYFNKNTDENFICSNFFRVIRLKSNINSKYIFWLLHYIYFQPIIMRFQQQTTGLINFKFQEYLDLEILVPSNPNDQEYIARVLDNLQNLINLQKNIIRKLVSKKQGLLNDLLTRGVDSQGNLRPSYEDVSALYQETELGFIPKEWNILSVSDFSDFVTSGSRGWASYYAESGALFIRIGNLSRENLDMRFESVVYVNPPKSADGLRTKLQEGDILISITADLGIIGVVPKNFGDAFINQHVALVRPKAGFNSRFIGYYLASSESQKQIETYNDGGAKAGLNLPTIRNLKVALPNSINEQNAIAEKLDVINSQILSSKNELNKLEQIKIGLLKDLLQN